MFKRIVDHLMQPWAPWVYCGLVMIVMMALTPPEKEKPYPTADDIVYFRDDVNRTCFAYLRGHPTHSLVVVNCDDVRWP